MLKIIALFIIIGAIGLAWFNALTGTFTIAIDTIKQYLASDSVFYQLVGKFFIIGSHPLFQIGMSLGLVLIGVRLLFR